MYYMNSGCGNTSSGISGAAFALVLFILLVIILGAFIQKGSVDNMCCNNSNTGRGNGFFVILILFILLAIMFSATNVW